MNRFEDDAEHQQRHRVVPEVPLVPVREDECEKSPLVAGGDWHMQREGVPRVHRIVEEHVGEYDDERVDRDHQTGSEGRR